MNCQVNSLLFQRACTQGELPTTKSKSQNEILEYFFFFFWIELKYFLGKCWQKKKKWCRIMLLNFFCWIVAMLLEIW